jgi:hypothetical protein
MPAENGRGPQGYLLFVWSPTGYTLRELDGETPHVGDEVDEGLVVMKVGSSPFAGDARACAYTMGKG